MRKFTKRFSIDRAVYVKALEKLDKGLLADDFMNGGLRIICKNTRQRQEATRLLKEGGVPHGQYSCAVLKYESIYALSDEDLCLHFLFGGIEYLDIRYMKQENVVKFRDIFRLYRSRTIKPDAKVFWTFYRIKGEENE